MVNIIPFNAQASKSKSTLTGSIYTECICNYICTVLVEPALRYKKYNYDKYTALFFYNYLFFLFCFKQIHTIIYKII